jgi:hypothetical protein
MTVVTKRYIPPELRQGIVRHFGAALAEAWRKQHQNDERPERLEPAAGRDVHEGDFREHDEAYHT